MVKFWKSGLKLLMYREKEAFWYYKYCSTYRLKFYAADICCSLMVFSNVYIIDSSTYFRPTVALSSNYQRLPSRNTFRRTDWSIVKIHFKWSVGRLNVMVIADSLSITRKSRDDGILMNLWCERLQKPAVSIKYPQLRLSTCR